MNDPSPNDGERLEAFASRREAGAFEALVRRACEKEAALRAPRTPDGPGPDGTGSR